MTAEFGMGGRLPDRRQPGQDVGLGAAERERLFSGGSELAGLMLRLDWASTPIGAPEQWPQSLKTAVRIMLTSQQPIWIGWGRELIYLYNDPYKAIIGGKHPWALGRPTSEVWHEIWEDIGPLLAKASGGDQGTYVEAQLLIMERNGFPEETYYTFSYSPIPDDDGSPGGIFCANTDDTQRVISERQLSLLRALANAGAEARSVDQACASCAQALAQEPRDLPFVMIYMTEPDGETARLEALTGIARDHPAVQPRLRLHPEQPWPLAEALRRQAAVLVRELPRVFGVAFPSGGWRQPPQQAVVMPIPSSGETGQGGFVIAGLNPFRLYDESYARFLNLVAGQIAAAVSNGGAYEAERRRAEALAAVDRAKTTFFSNISHEFRTPLTLMLGPLEDMLARDEGIIAAEERSVLNLIHRNGLRLMKLVNTLLDFSRIEAGRMTARFEPVDLGALTTELVSNFRSATDRAGLCLVIEAAALPEPVHVDRDMWEKIVLNLISNAFKFTFEGEIAVVIGLSADRRDAELRVRDTGTGIPPRELPHLFERFRRIDGARGRSIEGSGIGLALVQELVKLHGGEITAESEFGRGSTFTVRIPLGTAHLPAGQVASSRGEGPAGRRAQAYIDEALGWMSGDVSLDLPPPSSPDDIGLQHVTRSVRDRVVLADDNSDMRDYVRRLLGDEYEVETVADGVAALEAIRRRRPDLILTDVMMPRLDGFGLLKTLRGDAQLRDVPVVILSARAGEEAKVEGLDAGASDYLSKPFSARELLARVRVNIDLARIRRAAETTLRDVNERLEAQVSERTAELQAKEARLRTVFEASYTFQALLSSDGILLDANATSLEAIAAPLHEVAGQPFWETPWFAGTPGMPEAIRALVDAVARGDEARQELHLDLPVGGWRWFDFQMRPVRDETGQVVAIVPEAVEQTERRKAEEAFRQAQKMEAIGQLTGGVAHDFNNLLTVIRSSADLLRRRQLSPERMRRYVDAISDTADRAAKLTGQLLAFARRTPMERQVFDVAGHIEQIGDMLQTVLGAPAVIELDLRARPLPVDVDVNQFETALVNLVANARDAMNGRGVLTIRGDRVQQQGASGAQPFVSIAVSDTGCGIAADQIDRIFEPFFTTKGVGRGTGLGLSQVYGFVHQSGGRVLADSELGKGTTLTLLLPLTSKPLGRRERNEDRPDTLAARWNVLVVEDNPEIGEFSTQLLEDLGYRTVLARSGLDALRLIEDNPDGFDLVLSDVVMPGMDGVTLCQEIRRRLPSIPIVLNSGYSDVLADGDRHGFSLIHKPYSVDELSRVLRQVMAARGADPSPAPSA
ncbi:putative sensor histidine kinase with multiple PAS and a response regulator receiver domain (modular protein) [Bradyrhizobium sp. STM 3809]|nr:putative sensor histidine kinase with multiple PAS and a response regulator receiver domain (modular protein) [Bradyrhizobium sp. STM 3809]